MNNSLWYCGDQIWIRGDPQKFVYLWYPLLPIFYCIFKKEFSKCILLILAIFFEKFPRNLWNFLIFFKNRKITIIFEPKLVQKTYINQNLAKISPKTTKTADFSLKLVIFSKFSAPSAPKMYTFDTQKGSLLEASPPPQIRLWWRSSQI